MPFPQTLLPPLSAALSLYSAQLLTPADADDLQHLYERCSDYAHLEQGEPYSPHAARDEFETVPNGKTTRDKFILALRDSSRTLVALIECIRGYPDNQTWWVGLMLLAPTHRSQGVGTHFYWFFERWVSLQGAHHVALGVLEENERALRFWQNLGFHEIRRTPPTPYGTKRHVVFVLQRSINAPL